jgi:hypothetical protein
LFLLVISNDAEPPILSAGLRPDLSPGRKTGTNAAAGIDADMITHKQVKNADEGSQTGQIEWYQAHLLTNGLF